MRHHRFASFSFSCSGWLWPGLQATAAKVPRRRCRRRQAGLQRYVAHRHLESTGQRAAGPRTSWPACLLKEGISFPGRQGDSGKAGPISGPAWSRRPSGGPRRTCSCIHMDVVPAGPGWRVQPFGGRGPERLSSGAWHARRQEASANRFQLAALGGPSSAARVPIRPRTVIFLAVADEENGGLRGTGLASRSAPRALPGGGGGDRRRADGARREAGGKLLWWGIAGVAESALCGSRSRPPAGAVHGAGLNPDSPKTINSFRGSPGCSARPPRFPRQPSRAGLRQGHPRRLQNPHWRRVFGNIDRRSSPRAGPKGVPSCRAMAKPFPRHRAK